MTTDVVSLDRATRTKRTAEVPGGGERRLAHAPHINYHLVVPSNLRRAAPVLVLVHGISRNVDEHVRWFANAAAARGAIVVAPVFSLGTFPNYQRLGGLGRGPRADHALDAILAEVRVQVPMAGGQLLLYGHSGGGQFVHRYVMAHPDGVARYVVSAAGWYTWPDPTMPFPDGTGPTPGLADLAPDPQRFLTVPGQVLVGARDTRRSRTLNAAERIDRQQGSTRLERGRRWVGAMNTGAGLLGLSPPLRFRELPNSGHLFTSMVTRGGLVDASLDFLLGPDSA